MKFTEIMATEERMEVLDEFGIRYYVDDELNLVLENKDYDRAVKLMQDALTL